MKKLLLLTFVLMLLSTWSNAQVFQFSSVSRNDTAVNSALRYSWRVPYRFKITDLKKDNRMFGVVNLKNEGVIFDEGRDRKVMRGIFAGLETGFVFYIKNFGISPSFGVDYQLHYKEKIFMDKNRSDKEVVDREWFSNKLTKFNYFARLGLGKKDGLMVFAEVYFLNFVNQDYSTEVNGSITHPFKGLEINRFNIGLSYIFDGESNKRTFKAKIE